MDRAGAGGRPRSAPRCGGAISSSRSRCPTRSASSSATAGRSPMTAAIIPRAQASALEAADYAGFPARQAAARRAGRYLGIGISNAVESTGLGPYEGATVRVSTTGKIVLYTGATPQGQSHKTTLAQIAADQLGVSYEDVTVATADTKDDRLRRRHLRGAHRGQCRLLGPHRGARGGEEDQADRGRDDGGVGGRPRAARRLCRGARRPRHEEELSRDFAVRSIGMPGFSMAGGLPPGLENTAYFTARPVDLFQRHPRRRGRGRYRDRRGEDRPLHGDARLRHRHQSDGGGRPGGRRRRPRHRQCVVRAAGARRGRAAAQRRPSPTICCRARPTCRRSTSCIRETPSPLNPLGMKGAGEGGTIPAIAAIIAAVENALAPFGVKINEAPISPARIVALIAEARARRSDSGYPSPACGGRRDEEAACRSDCYFGFSLLTAKAESASALLEGRPPRIAAVFPVAILSRRGASGRSSGWRSARRLQEECEVGSPRDGRKLFVNATTDRATADHPRGAAHCRRAPMRRRSSRRSAACASAGTCRARSRSRGR